MHTSLEDARLVVAQLLYLLEAIGPDGQEVEVPQELTDLGPVQLSPSGVQERMETLVAGSCRALLAVLDVASGHGLGQVDALRQAALLLARDD